MSNDLLASKDYVLLTGSANPKLASAVGIILGKKVYETVSLFADGEEKIEIPENLRRRDVFIIQPTSPPSDNHVMELIFMIDAARRASAHEITTVIPYFGYARQDRKDRPRVPISSSVVASLIEYSGANRIVTVDIHSEQQQGFIKAPWDNLYGSFVFIPVIKKLNLKNLVVAAPDKNGVARASAYADRLGADSIAIVYKERDLMQKNISSALDMIGNVKEKNVLIIDDMYDTGGTICNAAKLLKNRGAKSVIAVVTHGIFSGDGLRKLEESVVEKLYITDTINLSAKIKASSKIEVVSIAPLIAEAIKCIQTGESISQKLILNS